MKRISNIATAFACLIAAACGGDAKTDLNSLLICNDAAVGGQALRALQTIAKEVEIEEPGFTATGHFLASRDGRMRIDVSVNGQRVFSEGYSDGSAWQLTSNATEPEPSSADGTAALRHSIEQPGHLWTLADMQRNGHKLQLLEPETIDNTEYAVIQLTLSDGFENWYWLNTASCFVERNRNFRSFHPDIEPDKSWTETVFEEFRQTDGVTLPHRVRTVDLQSGETLGTTRLIRVRGNPEIEDF